MELSLLKLKPPTFERQKNYLDIDDKNYYDVISKLENQL
jgi:hypothetical protein